MTVTRIITIVCWAIAAIVLLGLAAWFLLGAPFSITGGFSFGSGSLEVLTGSYELTGTYSAPVSGIDSLKIDWVAGDVTVEPYDGADILIREYAQRELDENERLSVGTSGGTVTIKFRENNNAWRMPSKKLEVFVPRALCGSFNSLTAESTSGRLYISDVTAVTFNADTVSGGAELSNIKAHTLEVDSMSGSIIIPGADADSITLNSISGSVTLSDSRAETLSVDSTSGSQKLSGTFGKVGLSSISGDLTLENPAAGSSLKADTTSGSQNMSGSFDSADLNSISGSIKLQGEIAPSSLKTDTTSGTVTVTIPQSDGITVSHSSVSGKFSSDIAVTMQNSGARFRFSSTSGDVKIFVLD